MCENRRKSDKIFKLLDYVSFIFLAVLIFYFVYVELLHQSFRFSGEVINYLAVAFLSLVYIIGIKRNKHFNKMLKNEVQNLIKIKELEQSINYKEEKFYQIYNNSPDMIAIIHREGYIITDINETAIIKLGYSKDEVIGKNLLKTPVIFENDKEKLKERLDYAFQNPNEIVQCKIRKISKDGDMFHIIERMYVMKNSGNNSLLMICKDITEEITAKTDREIMSEKYETILENISEVVFELDGKLRFSFVNNAIYEILGYRENDMLGVSVLRYMLEQDKEELKREYQKRVDALDSLPKTKIFPMVHKNDQMKLIEFTTRIVFDEFHNVAGVYGVAKDVTEKHTQKIMRKKKIIEKSNTVLKEIEKVRNNIKSIKI